MLQHLLRDFSLRIQDSCSPAYAAVGKILGQQSSNPGKPGFTMACSSYGYVGPFADWLGLRILKPLLLQFGLKLLV